MQTKQLLLPFFFLFLFTVTHMPLMAQWNVSTPIPTATGLEDGMAFDSEGNLYISQYQGSAVHKFGVDGTVSVFADGFNTPNGLAVDATGHLYVANVFGGRISRVTSGGAVTQDFISIANPSNVILNPSGDTLYVAHYRGSRISRVAIADPTNIEVWVSGAPLNGPIGMDFDDDGNLYVGNYNNGNIFRISPGGEVTQLATIQSFLGFLVLSNGWLYATSYNRNEVYRLRPDGSALEVIAGSGSAGQADGQGTAASFNGPNGIIASTTGDTLYVSEFNTGKLRMMVSAVPTDIEHNTASDVLPSKPLLDAQTYPNPFHASTTISWTLTRPGPVSVDIFNLLGQRVRTLTPDSRVIGTHSIIWDGRDEAGLAVPTAAYIVAIRTENSVVSRTVFRR